MSIQLINNVAAPVLTESYLQQIYRAVRRCVHLPKQLMFTVVTVGRSQIRQLNRQYRQQDKVTDVLSFSYNAEYGEVIVCYSQAVQQANAKQNPLKKELAWLVIHGILHIMGYDHDQPNVAQVMRALEVKILTYV